MTTSERSIEEIVERARSGDEHAFQEMIDPHLRELHVHCYRMLGSLVDADDLVQETITAAWNGMSAFEGRSSPRTWLYRIATNRCLNAIRDEKRRPPTEPIPPFTPPSPTSHGDVTWCQPYPHALIHPEAGPEERLQSRESIELAFIVALQRLPPRQTAALVLCDVLGYSVGEAAQMLDCSQTAAKGLLQRARRALGEYRSSSSGAPETALATKDEVAGTFAAAFVANDFDTLVTLLTDDAWLAMPPAPHVYEGMDAIMGFLKTSFAWRGDRFRHLAPTRANGQPAFVFYMAETPESGSARANGVIVLTLCEGRIRGVTHFIDARLPPRFGFPESIEEQRDHRP